MWGALTLPAAEAAPTDCRVPVLPQDSIYIFREGALPPYRQMFYQLCDLNVDEYVRGVGVSAPRHRRDRASPKPPAAGACLRGGAGPPGARVLQESPPCRLARPAGAASVRRGPPPPLQLPAVLFPSTAHVGVRDAVSDHPGRTSIPELDPGYS